MFPHLGRSYMPRITYEDFKILLKEKILQDYLYDKMVTFQQDIGGSQPLIVHTMKKRR
jgi:hypothetical protein